MPRECKFGRGCTRDGCWYGHSSGREIDSTRHLVITDGADNCSIISLEEICDLVAKSGLPHYHLLVIGAGMGKGNTGRAQMQQVCGPAHCTFVSSTADLSQLYKLLGKFKEEVRMRMELLVQEHGKTSLTEWQGNENDAAAAVGQLLGEATLLASHLSAFRLCGDSGGGGGGGQHCRL
jgi:hypothetical protein